MKVKGLFGIVAVLVLIASFVVPGNFATPSPVSADPGKMEWTWVQTPDSLQNVIDNLFTPIDVGGTGIESGSEIIKFQIGNDGQSIYALVRVGFYYNSPADGQVIILKSMNGGVSWMGGPNTPISALQNYLERDFNVYHGFAAASPVTVYDIALAPDDPNIIIVATSNVTSPAAGVFQWGQEVWISTDGGTFWENTNWPGTTTAIPGTDIISSLAISMSYGEGRYIMVGTRDGTGLGLNNIQTMRIPGYGGWAWTATPLGMDVIVAKFSPTFIGDSTIAVVYSTAVAVAGTYLMTGAHDIFANITTWQPAGTHVEIKDPLHPAGSSPDNTEIWVGDLEMPSDFSGQTASLRRFYVSTAADDGAGIDHGIFRVDDNVVYTLMLNTDINFKKIYSIAYWGTYASGKLMAGEIFGWTCLAQVPVWFTDSPTVCPVPCWYPAKKPPTGAAGCILCNENMRGFGNAWVEWSPTYADQGVAYASTGYSGTGDYAAPDGVPTVLDPCAIVEAVGEWPDGIIFHPVPLDESAFALTRNNGATWNELSLIDTRIAKLTDVAPSADCTTVYLASVNNSDNCTGFDSVWRSSSNEKVVAPPLPASPIGSIWERVFCHVTAEVCDEAQSNYAILRLAPDKVDGQVVGWAAGGTSALVSIAKCDGVAFPVGGNTQAVAWSPDYGDFWGTVIPRINVQDMAFQDSTTLHVVSLDATAQKLPYTGTAWSSASPTVQTNLSGFAHTIEATGAGRVIVAGSGPADAAIPSSFAASFSPESGSFFIPFTQPTRDQPLIGYHAIFDTDFETNATVYLCSDANSGKVRRNTAPAGTGKSWSDMCQNFTGPFWWTNHRAYYGMAQTNSKNVNGQGTLYAAHRPGDVTTPVAPRCVDIAGNTIPQPIGCVTPWSGVERTLRPLDGIPKPGIEWSCLDASDALYRTPATVEGVWFTLEPEALKICGCLTQETDATLYAIDNDWYADNHNSVDHLGGVAAVRDRGMLWAYTDCIAKVGPTLTMDDGTIIGCDPATGRNQEVNFTWEQLCIANWYQFVLAKDNAMTQAMVSASLSPFQVTSPALILFAGGEGSAPDFATPFTWGSATAAGKGSPPSLECGHTFYWMIRVIEVVTQEGWTGSPLCAMPAGAAFNEWGVPSPWSEIRSFTVKAGFRVTTPYYGVQLLAPDNGCGCACAAPVCFSWSPFKETAAYKFELSENADMSSPLVSTTVNGATAYQYTGTIKCNTNYFWRVMATEPAPSEWSATFSFMTQPEPPPPPAAPDPEPTPIWVWVVIAIGAILVIVTLVLIFKTRRV
jgi:hypothetical protein